MQESKAVLCAILSLPQVMCGSKMEFTSYGTFWKAYSSWTLPLSY